MADQTPPRDRSEEHPTQPTEVTGHEVAKAGRTGALLVWPGFVMAAIAIVVILYFVLR
jgi:hypothetical protein